MSRLWSHFLGDPLFRNSIYLMMTTAFMGMFGFFFWMIATRLFTPEQIGVGTTLISAMTLISSFSLLGFDSTLIRFLPHSKNRNDEINTASTLVLLGAVFMSVIYIIAIPYFTPTLGIVRESMWYSIGFIVIVACASINSLMGSIFVAYRSAHYTLITNGFIISAAKLLLPFVFVMLGAYGVFAASGLATFIGMAASIVFLIFKFNYVLSVKISAETVRKVFRYSFGNYLANLLSLVPTFVLPVIIIHYLGAAPAGFYYLAFMVISILYSVSISVSQSLFAEGSHSENLLRALTVRSIITLTAIMVPAGIVLAFVGPYILTFFGQVYSTGGAGVIAVFAIAAPAVAAYNLGSTLLRIRHQVRALVCINAVYALTMCGLAYLWVDNGVVWIAIAWAVGNTIAALLAFVTIFLKR